MQLSVLVSKANLTQVEKELKSIVTKNNALGLSVQKLGNFPSFSFTTAKLIPH